MKSLVRAWGRHLRRLGRNPGFSLVEMVIALAVVSVTFIGIIGLLGLGVASDQTSSLQTGGTNIADSILADLRSTPNFSATSTRYGLTLPTTLPGTTATPLAGVTPSILYFDVDGNFIAPINPGSPPAGAVYAARVYAIKINSVGPSALPALTQTMAMVRIVVSWPAASTTVIAGSVEVVTQLRLH